MTALQKSRQALAKAKMKETRESRLVRAFRVEIVKPLGEETWDTIGPILRAYRSVMHRVINAATLDSIEFENRRRRGETVVDAKTAVVPFAAGIPNAQTAAYRAIAVELADVRDYYTRELDRLERGEARRTKVPKKVKQGNRFPSETKANPEQQVEREKDRMRVLANIELPGAITVGITQAAFTSAQKFFKDRGIRIPSAKYGAPIPVLKANTKLRVDQAGRPLLEIKLRSKGSVEFAIRAGDGVNWQTLRSIVDGRDGYEIGDCKLTYDPNARGEDGKRKGKWFAIIAYSYPKPPVPHADQKNLLILHRGLRNLLVAMDLDGHGMQRVASGTRLTQAKRRFKARRLSVKSIKQAERGSGATGHGRKRFYRLPDELETKEADWIKTHCQQIAAAVEALRIRWGAGRVAIEQYGGLPPDEERARRQFVDHPPYNQLRDAIKNRLERSGVVLEEYSPEYISQTCPRCGDRNPRHHNTRTGGFHCSECDFQKDVDEVACIHALRRMNEGKDPGKFEERYRRSAALGAAVKGTEK